jgi:hypothetical protein
MDVRRRAEKTAQAVSQILPEKPPPDLQQRIAEVIERTLLDAVVENGEQCVKLAMKCCSADRDLAHKIAEQIRRSHAVLIANLTSMR